VPPWRNSLRQSGFVSVATAITYHPIRRATLISVIGIFEGGGWGRRLHSRRWSNFGIGGILLTHLFFFFIRVTKDDDLAIARWPMDIVVEVVKESPGELLIS
jgi:hypothetical protein